MKVRFDYRTGPFVAGLVVVAGYAAWNLVSTSRAEAAFDSAISRAEAEKSRLDKILEELKVFDRKKAELERRIARINEVFGDHPRPGALLELLVPESGERVRLETVEYRDRQAVVRGTADNSRGLREFVSRVSEDSVVSKDSTAPSERADGARTRFEWVIRLASENDEKLE